MADTESGQTVFREPRNAASSGGFNIPQEDIDILIANMDSIVAVAADIASVRAAVGAAATINQNVTAAQNAATATAADRVTVAANLASAVTARDTAVAAAGTATTQAGIATAAAAGLSAVISLKSVTPETASRNNSAADLGKLILVDASAGDVTYTYLQNTYTSPTATDRGFIGFQKVGGGDANGIVWAVPGGSALQVGVVGTPQRFQYRSPAAGGVDNMDITPVHTLNIPVVTNGLLVLVEHLAFAAGNSLRDVVAKLDGLELVPDINLDGTGASGAMFTMVHAVPLGNVAVVDTTDFNIRADTSGGLTAYGLLAFVAENAAQVSPLEGNIQARHSAGDPGSGTVIGNSIITAGPKRLVIGSFVSSDFNALTKSLTGTGVTSFLTFEPGGANNRDFQGVSGRQTAATAGSYAMGATFSLANELNAIGFAIKPAAAGGSVSLKVNGNKVPKLTEMNRQVWVQYGADGSSVDISSL